jgi:hypothetical protein
VRQLKGVRIKEVRQRMRGVALMPEKQAIETMRRRSDSKGDATNGLSAYLDDTETDSQRHTRQMQAFLENETAMLTGQHEEPELEAEIQKTAEEMPKKEKQPTATPKEGGDVSDSLPKEPYNVQVNPIHYDPSSLSDKAKPAPPEPYQVTINPVTYTAVGLQKPTAAKVPNPAEAIEPAAASLDKQRQQAKFAEFMDNAQSDSPAPELGPEPTPGPKLGPESDPKSDEALQKLVEEQKAIRERTRQKNQQRNQQGGQQRGPKRRC